MGSTLPSIAGIRFGELTALTEMPRGRWGRRWLCVCDCGNFSSARQGDLRSGKTSSCGCKFERSKIKHGRTKTPEYVAWRGMRARCERPTAKRYENYGGRGIRVCARWRTSFEAFFADMGPRPSNKHSLDRIDVNGHYEPGNCRWATIEEQAANTTRTISVEIDGNRLSLSQAARLYGKNYGCAQQLVYHGADPVEALKAAPLAGKRDKSRCPKGHDLTGDNLMISRGRRCCRECYRGWARNWRARNAKAA